MKTAFSLLLLALLAGSAIASYSDYTEDDSDFDLEKADNAGSLSADASQLQSVDDSLANAPASIPQDLITSFATELRSIRVSLEGQRDNLRKSLGDKEAKVASIKKAIEKEQGIIAQINEKARKLRERLLRKDKNEYDHEIAAAEKKVKDLEQSLKWVETLSSKVAVLKEGADDAADAAAAGTTVTADAGKKYEETLAEIKDDLNENVDDAEDLTGLDVSGSLEELEMSSEIEEESEKKLYEATKLKALVAQMRAKVAELKKKAEEELKAIHEAKLPHHLRKGLAKAKAALARLQQELTAAQAALDAAKATDAKRLAGIEKELAKVAAIRRHLNGEAAAAAAPAEDLDEEEESDDEDEEESEDDE